MNDEKQQWFDAMKAKGHLPMMDELYDHPELNIWVVDVGFHNGPGCETCHWSCCMHCDSIESIPQCDNPCLDLETVKLITQNGEPR